MRDAVRGPIAAKIKAIRSLENTAKQIQKTGKPTNEKLNARIEEMKLELMEKIRSSRR